MPLIELSHDAETAIVSFARPPANAFNLALAEEFSERLAEIAARPPKGGLVVTGKGAVFSGGVDFKEAPRYGDAERRRMVGAINRGVAALYALPTATVAAVNGHAIGGAFVLMLACDTRLAADTDAKMGLTEVTAGIPYPACPMEVVKAELAGRDRRVLVLTGEMISPQAARERSLVDELAAPGALLRRAVEIARANAALASYARVKEQLRRDTISRMREIIETESDPMLGRWI